MKRLLFVFILFFSLNSFAQIERVEPLHWWVGFQVTELQLLVKGNGIGSSAPTLSYKGVSIESIQKGDSPNYLFLNLNIEKGTKPGKFEIVFKQKNKKKFKYTYELKQRLNKPDQYIGFNSADVIYLITPDRFSNGNTANDINTKMREKAINRNDNYGRHGGDIKGILNHLDYINDMGFTAIWSTPLLINDMAESSYHGYAITDFYQVDPRFGSLEEYIELSEKVKEKGMKLVMDQVANHCGSEHWWMKDLPFNDWINYQDNYLNNDILKTSNHRRTTNQDPYASQIDANLMTQGWFVSAMPDLNHNNPFMAKYVIQNSIWWIETLGLGGIRQDTYPYSDKKFMASWAGSIMKEYPNFSIVGEEWSYNPLLLGYWQNGANNNDGYQSNLKSVMDFPMQKNIVDALNEEESWDKGLVKIYEGLANDFHYTSPLDIMIFPDNHDMDRIYTQLHNDLVLTKMALGYLLALPRIPQIYYGTEVLIDNSDKPGDHGLIRTDFPGGWGGDTIDAFTGSGLTDDQLEMQHFLKSVLNYRKKSEAIHSGATKHFAPENGIYTFFRIKDEEIVVLILNKNKSPMSLNLDRFEEIALKGKVLKNIISDKKLVWDKTLELEAKGIYLFSTKLD